MSADAERLDPSVHSRWAAGQQAVQSSLQRLVASRHDDQVGVDELFVTIIHHCFHASRRSNDLEMRKECDKVSRERGGLADPKMAYAEDVPVDIVGGEHVVIYETQTPNSERREVPRNFRPDGPDPHHNGRRVC